MVSDTAVDAARTAVPVPAQASRRPRYTDGALVPVGPSVTPPEYTDLSKYSGIDWWSAGFIFVPHIVFAIGVFYVGMQIKTILFSWLIIFCVGMSITGGYHRMWSHRAFKARLPVRIFFALFGAAALQGSAKWWCRHHRAHHRFADTSKDPYNVRKGLLWAHLGWMIFKRERSTVGQASISDLRDDWVLMWQSRWYKPLALLMGFGVSTAVPALLWDDLWGGVVYGTMLRIMVVHHSTFFVNSLAHWVGDQPFSYFQTAVDSWVTALLTFGEGYHNYHHAFCQDYRNGVYWYQYDPTKWFIRALKAVGLVYDLHRTPDNEVLKSEVQAAERRLAILRAEQGGDGMLELWTQAQFEEAVDKGQKVMIVNGDIVDVSKLLSVEHGTHPGGRDLLEQNIGKDATKLYFGEAGHIHTHSAQQLMRAYRVARLARRVECADGDE